MRTGWFLVKVKATVAACGTTSSVGHCKPSADRLRVVWRNSFSL